jgi:hypothetical protein
LKVGGPKHEEIEISEFGSTGFLEPYNSCMVPNPRQSVNSALTLKQPSRARNNYPVERRLSHLRRKLHSLSHNEVFSSTSDEVVKIGKIFITTYISTYAGFQTISIHSVVIKKIRRESKNQIISESLTYS